MWTARLSTADPDRLNVTRGSGYAHGLAFAPSRPLLDLGLLGEITWEEYAASYTEEMRASYRANRPTWDKLLGRRRVVLCCYCVDATRCHRTVLADILGKLGAEVCGELEEAPRVRLQVRLPGV